ncbi:MAG: hypothetical protein Ct9H300mP11_04000 [Chloroflexota bacterium]|nr:MAG: hypothetical protein Ct9H300mP11_04000 [Chloroflexota bacterium]
MTPTWSHAAVGCLRGRLPSSRLRNKGLVNPNSMTTTASGKPGLLTKTPTTLVHFLVEKQKTETRTHGFHHVGGYDKEIQAEEINGHCTDATIPAPQKRSSLAEVRPSALHVPSPTSTLLLPIQSALTTRSCNMCPAQGDGAFDFDYIIAESEHSQFEIVKHASAVGARTFTGSSGVGGSTLLKHHRHRWSALASGCMVGNRR